MWWKWPKLASLGGSGLTFSKIAIIKTIKILKKIKNGFGYAVLYSINYCVLRRWIGLENAKFHWKIPFLGCFVKRCLHLLQPGFFPKFSMIVGDMYRNVTDWYICLNPTWFQIKRSQMRAVINYYMWCYLRLKSALTISFISCHIFQLYSIQKMFYLIICQYMIL